MKTWRATILGILGIGALVAAAGWFPNHPEYTRWPFAFLDAAAAGGAPARHFAVTHVDWSGDGRTLLSVSRGEFDAEGYLALHDTTQKNGGTPIDVVGDPVDCAALSPGGLHLVVGTPAGRLLWIDWQAREELVLAEILRPKYFTRAVVAVDGRHVAAATNAGEIYLCDTVQRTSAVLKSPLPHAISDVRFSRDGARLVSAQGCGAVNVWEAATGTLVQEFPGNGPATNAEFLADGKRIITASLDDSIRIWDIESRELVCCREGGLYGISALAVSPDGRTAAWGGFRRKIEIWDLEPIRKTIEIDTSASVVMHLQFSPDGSSLAAAGMEATIRRYDVHTAVEIEGSAIDVSQGGAGDDG